MEWRGREGKYCVFFLSFVGSYVEGIYDGWGCGLYCVGKLDRHRQKDGGRWLFGGKWATIECDG